MKLFKWIFNLGRKPTTIKAILPPKPTTKQVIVMRGDLNMPPGKMVAQGAHASLAFIGERLDLYGYDILFTVFNSVELDWFENSFTKICVFVYSEEELLKIQEQAEEAGLECHLITDDGRTVFNGVLTNTCLAIGPDYSYEIDKITGHLSLKLRD